MCLFIKYISLRIHIHNKMRTKIRLFSEMTNHYNQKVKTERVSKGY